MPEFTDDDRGKPVENANGDRVGTIETVEGDVAYVRPNADAVDSIKSSIGWESRADESLPLDREAVAEVTDEAVRLEGALLDRVRAESEESSGAAGSASGMDETDASEATEDAESAANQGLSADPSAMTDDASGFEVNPDDVDDEFDRNDAAVDPDEDAQPTDAAVEPDDEFDRDDAEVERGEDEP
ncbi:hypothetical protein [Halopiger thermotolerans]